VAFASEFNGFSDQGGVRDDYAGYGSGGQFCGHVEQGGIGAVAPNWPFPKIGHFHGSLPPNWSILPDWPVRRRIGHFMTIFKTTHQCLLFLNFKL
jgi:hypothetical protein